MAVYPLSAGAADYSSNSSSGFIPIIWAAEFLEKWNEGTIYNDICNTDYEGIISKKGDTVKMLTVPSIDVHDHVDDQDLEVQLPESPDVEMKIDRGKYFNFQCTDIQKHQSSNDLMAKFGTQASDDMKISIDKDFLGGVYADADSHNYGATAGVDSGDINLGASGAPKQTTSSNIIDFIVDCGTVLDENDVPDDEQWWMALPHWATGLIKKSEIKDASMSGDTISPMRNGRIGRVDRFTIYGTKHLSTATDGSTGNPKCWRPLFGHKSAITFATQLTEMEDIRAERAFKTYVRGLQVFGFKTVHPKGLGVGYICK